MFPFLGNEAPFYKKDKYSHLSPETVCLSSFLACTLVSSDPRTHSLALSHVLLWARKLQLSCRSLGRLAAPLGVLLEEISEQLT